MAFGNDVYITAIAPTDAGASSFSMAYSSSSNIRSSRNRHSFEDHAIHQAMVFATDSNAYFQAVALCPGLIERESPLDLFARFEDYNVWKAAQRLANYWALRLQVFGEGAAFQPLVDGLDEADIEQVLFQDDIVPLLPFMPTSNRAVAFWDRTQLERKTSYHRSMFPRRMRCDFFCHQQMMMLLESQREPTFEFEFIIKVDPGCLTITPLDYEIGKNVRLRNEAFCSRRMAIHLVIEIPPASSDSFLSGVWHRLLQASKSAALLLAAPASLHMGTPPEIRQTLTAAGFRSDGIPSSCGGTWDFQRDWVDRIRRSLEQSKSNKASPTLSSLLAPPRPDTQGSGNKQLKVASAVNALKPFDPAVADCVTMSNKASVTSSGMDHSGAVPNMRDTLQHSLLHMTMSASNDVLLQDKMDVSATTVVQALDSFSSGGEMATLKPGRINYGSAQQRISAGELAQETRQVAESRPDVRPEYRSVATAPPQMHLTAMEDVLFDEMEPIEIKLALSNFESGRIGEIHGQWPSQANRGAVDRCATKSCRFADAAGHFHRTGNEGEPEHGFSSYKPVDTIAPLRGEVETAYRADLFVASGPNQLDLQAGVATDPQRNESTHSSDWRDMRLAPEAESARAEGSSGRVRSATFCFRQLNYEIGACGDSADESPDHSYPLDEPILPRVEILLQERERQRRERNIAYTRRYRAKRKEKKLIKKQRISRNSGKQVRPVAEATR